MIRRNPEYVELDICLALWIRSDVDNLHTVSKYHFLGTIYKGELKLLFEGQTIPILIKPSNSALATANLSGARRRGLEKGGCPFVVM